MRSENSILPAWSEARLLLWLVFILGLFLASRSLGGNFYPGVSPGSVFVPGGTVAYQFDASVNPTEQVTYLDGLREWELAGNIHFVPHTTETNWILFQYAPGTGIDHFDLFSVPEVVTVSVLSRSQVCHEMGHALGFDHENIRIDQTNYLTVLTNNIYPASNIIWFIIDPSTVTNGPYDFESVMHLGNNFKSIDPTNLYTQLAKPGYEKFQPRMGNFALSKGDRAAATYLYGPPTVPLTNVVTNTFDVGPGTLRAALYYGIDHPGATIRFNISTNDPGYSNGAFTIHLTGFLPPLVTDGTIIDGSTQPGFSGNPVIVLDGSQIIPEAYDPGVVTGLLIYAANCQVKNLSFQNFGWNGLTIEYAYATNNTISGCWFGLDATGTNAAPNVYQGILISAGASGNIIGGTNALSRNVLSGNLGNGIFITDSNTTRNIVEGNYVGTDFSGTRAIQNAVGGIVLQDGANSNIIGSPIPAGHNVLSGNFNYGLWVGTDNNNIQGNWMGLDSSGATALPNTFIGMYILGGVRSNLVTGNVLSGNYSEGIRLQDPGTTGNRVQNNLIGTDSTGTIAVPNGYAGLTFFNGAAGNTAGGLTPTTRNVISGNSGYGVVFGDLGTTGNLVEGNFIGVSADGIHGLANGTGVFISNGAQTNRVGGTVAGAANIISGNYYGVWIKDPNTSGNLVLGNYAGLAPDGVTPLGNAVGVYISDGAQSNTIGGTVAGAGNILSGNYNYGVWITHTNTTGNVVEGNYVGLTAGGSAALANGTGIYISNGARTNIVGGISASARNVVSGNQYSGVVITDPGTSWNSIQGDYVGTGANGFGALGNGYEAVDIIAGAQNNTVGGPAAGAGNVLSGNGTHAVWISDTNTINNLVQGNIIGLAADGVTVIGNASEGVVIRNGAQGNVIGLKTDGSGAGNRISASGLDGVAVFDDPTVGNTIRGNSIYTNGNLGINLVGGAQNSSGVTSNHLGGAVTGPNDLQNYPVITNAFSAGASTFISGALNSSALKPFLIDIYRSVSPDPSGYGEGQVYLGTVTATTSAGGNAQFSLSASGNFAGQYFTATATDQTSGDTSEFSFDVLATNAPVPPSFTLPFSLTSTGFAADILLTLGQSYHVQSTTNLGTNPIPWINLTNFVAGGSNYLFMDRSATNFRSRFYRVVSP